MKNAFSEFEAVIAAEFAGIYKGGEIKIVSALLESIKLITFVTNIDNPALR